MIISDYIRTFADYKRKTGNKLFSGKQGRRDFNQRTIMDYGQTTDSKAQLETTYYLKEYADLRLRDYIVDEYD